MPAGFDNTALGGMVWNSLQDQNCSTHKSFYACNGTQPTFWGCCTSNPCANNGVCPSDNLTAAFLGTNPVAWKFFTDNGSATTGGSSVSLPTSTGSRISSDVTQSKSSTNVGAIAGGAVGGFLVLVAVIAGLWWCKGRMSRRKIEAREPLMGSTEARYSTAPTLVPSNHPGSPTKSMLLPPLFTSAVLDSF
jgi:hypothetical protein